jgi:hypothetical protein
MTEMNDNLRGRIEWAIKPFQNGTTEKIIKTNEHTCKQIRDQANKDEVKWGNRMIDQTSNKQWTTLLGEGLVRDVLKLRGKNPRNPQTKDGYRPDIETDDAIWEVKTRCWTVSGTAGEKVPGVMYKYSDIPTSYGKPLKIVCVGYQEYELTHGTTKIFGEVSANKKAYLDLARSQHVEYVKFSDLVAPLLNDS